jgi:hypothetical protein
VYTRREGVVVVEEEVVEEEAVASLPPEAVASLSPRYLSDLLPTHLLNRMLLYADACQLVELQRTSKKMRTQADKMYRSSQWRCEQLRGREWSWDSSTDPGVQQGVLLPPRGAGTRARLTASIESVKDTSCESRRLFATLIVEEELVGWDKLPRSSDSSDDESDDDGGDNNARVYDPYKHSKKWRGQYCGNVVWGPDKQTNAVFEDDDENVFESFSFHVRLTEVERIGVAKRYRTRMEVSEEMVFVVDYDGELHARLPFDAENGSTSKFLDWSLGVDCESERRERTRLALEEVGREGGEAGEGWEEDWATMDSWKAAGTGEEWGDEEEDDSWANFDDDE